MPRSGAGAVEVTLDPGEAAPRRPFTSLAHYERDHAMMTSMLEDVRPLMAERRNGRLEVTPYKRITWRVHGLKRRFLEPVAG